MPITDYTDLNDGELLYEGQLATTEAAVRRTGFNEDTVPLVFGRAVVKATGDRGVRLPVDASSVLQGIAIQAQYEKRAGYSVNADDDLGYPVTEPVSVLIRGVIGVKVTENVTPTSPVFWIHNPDTGERKGQFRASANSSRAVQITNAKFLRSAAAGTVVPLAINLT